MALLLEAGIAVEPGRFTALVSPPGFLVDVLLAPEVDRFTSLYCYGVGSRVLHRLPRRAPRLETQSCMTVHQLLSSLREADQSVIVVEYDDGIVSPLEGEDREVVFAVSRQLRQLSREAAVLLWASRAERGFRALLGTADQVVWHYDERPIGPGRRRKRVAQKTLGEGGWAVSS